MHIDTRARTKFALPGSLIKRTLSDVEQSYNTTIRKCLEFIYAVLNLRPYLEGVQFSISTDHDDFKWLFCPTSASGKFADLCLHLQKFSFTVNYLSGKKNVAADDMYLLNTAGGDHSDKPIDVEVPVPSMEEEVNPPKLDNDEVSFPVIDKDYHPKLTKQILLEEMIAGQKGDL